MGEMSDYYTYDYEAQEERRRYAERDAKIARSLYETRPFLTGSLVDISRVPTWQVKKAFQDLGRSIDSLARIAPSANLPLPDIDGTETIMNEELRINMSVTDILREEMQREALQKELDRKRTLIAAFGQDTYNEGAVIKFHKYFPTTQNNPKRYEYAALKCDGKWYTTGPKTTAGFSWTDLVLWLTEDPTLPTEADDVWLQTDDITVGALAERVNPVAAIEGKIVEQPTRAKKAAPRKRATTK